ncbi:hypothetical protein [Ornithinicoccus hortensis]|uniref:Uncharacterized protein n=1 Tax=Ornithinicoccus hortensis TaxID=82346 RepID=A0A542YUE7_9MICO|nr:hypothetical protein [Ornithinicoccus hortensis]TQL51708.1 hypothetical protein FB467_2862 [Ornithinicoccus hortensis]
MTGSVPPGVLDFADVESLHDLGTYVGRARTLQSEGSVRLQASGSVLAAWVCILPGRGVLGQGVVLGLRVMPLAGEVDPPLDVTVPLGAVTDRLARRTSTGDVGTRLPVPPTTVHEPWSALTPPRSGWVPDGEVAVASLLGVAEDGIRDIAEGTPDGAGSHAVNALRERVWSAPLPTRSDLSAGVGLAAYGLGFGRAREIATVFRCGPWTRVSTAHGHILTR